MPTQPYLKSNLGWFNLVFFRSFQSIRDSEIESKLGLRRLKENWDKTPTTTNPLGLAAKILRICIADLIFIACLATVFCLCSYWSPMLTKDVIRAMGESVSSPMLVVLLAVSLAGLYLSLNHIFMRSFFLGYKAKYLVRRVLIVTQSQNETATLSGVLLESERIFRGFYALGLLIPSIASIAIAIILLQNFVGIGAWLGFVILCVLVGYSRSLARISAKRLEQTSKKYREKLSYVQFLSNNLLGVLLGSQLDRVFHDIRAKRREECEALISYSRSIVALQALFLFLPAIVIFVVLISAGLLHQKLTVATLFPSLLLLGTLRSAVGVLPSCYVSLVQGFHALKEVSQIFAIESERTQSKEVLQFDIQNRWITASKESGIIPAWLQQLPCEVKPAEISHDPWLFTGTLEQNVALGLNIDKVRIREILHFLNLTQELSIDDAENFQISKNGYNLSGGQRQRVALARIIYQDPEVILLDDGLSSIDPVLREAILMGLIDRWQGKIVLYLTGRPEEHACGSFSFCADTKRLLVNDFRPRPLHKNPSPKVELPSQDLASSAGSEELSSISIKHFVREFSGIFILSVIMMFSLRELLSIGLDLWLKNGAESGNIATHSAQFFLVYVALVLSVAATNLFLFKHIITHRLRGFDPRSSDPSSDLS